MGPMSMPNGLLDEFQAKFAAASVTPLLALNRRLLDWSSSNMVAAALPYAPLQGSREQRHLKLCVLYPAVSRTEYQTGGLAGPVHCLVPQPTALNLTLEPINDIDFVRFADKGDAFVTIDSSAVLIIWKAQAALNIWTPVYHFQLSSAALCAAWFSRTRNRRPAPGPHNPLSLLTLTCFTRDGELYTFWEENDGGFVFTHRSIIIPLALADTTHFISADLWPAYDHVDQFWTLATTLKSDLLTNCQVSIYKIEINTLSEQDSTEPPLVRCLSFESSNDSCTAIAVLAHDAQGVMLSVWRQSTEGLWLISGSITLFKIVNTFLVFTDEGRYNSQIVLGFTNGGVQIFDSFLASLHEIEPDEIVPIIGCALSSNGTSLIMMRSDHAVQKYHIPSSNSTSGGISMTTESQIAEQVMASIRNQVDFSDILDEVVTRNGGVFLKENDTAYVIIEALYKAYVNAAVLDTSASLWDSSMTVHVLLRRVFEFSLALYSQLSTTEVNYRLTWAIINLTMIESIFMSSLSDMELGESAIARLIGKPTDAKTTDTNIAEAHAIPTFKIGTLRSLYALTCLCIGKWRLMRLNTWVDSIISLTPLCSWVRDFCSYLTRQCYFALNLQVHTHRCDDHSDQTTTVLLTERASIVSLLFHPTALRTLRRLLALTVIFSRYLEKIQQADEKPDQAILNVQQQLLVLLGRTKIKLDTLSHWLSKMADIIQAEPFTRADELAILVRARIPQDKRYTSFVQSFHNALEYMVNPYQRLLNDATWLDINLTSAVQSFTVSNPLQHFDYWQVSETSLRRLLSEARRSLDVVKKWKLGRSDTIIQCVRCYRFSTPLSIATTITTTIAATATTISDTPSTSNDIQSPLMHAPWYLAFARNCMCGGQWWQLNERCESQFDTYSSVLVASAPQSS